MPQLALQHRWSALQVAAPQATPASGAPPPTPPIPARPPDPAIPPTPLAPAIPVAAREPPAPASSGVATAFATLWLGSGAPGIAGAGLAGIVVELGEPPVNRSGAPATTGKARVTAGAAGSDESRSAAAGARRVNARTVRPSPTMETTSTATPSASATTPVSRRRLESLGQGACRAVVMLHRAAYSVPNLRCFASPTRSRGAGSDARYGRGDLHARFVGESSAKRCSKKRRSLGCRVSSSARSYDAREAATRPSRRCMSARAAWAKW